MYPIMFVFIVIIGDSSCQTRYGPRSRPKDEYLKLIGPKGMEEHEISTCEDFTRTARFNPYSILKDRWFSFFYWAPGTTPLKISFLAPTQKEILYLHMFLEPRVKEPVNWTARNIIMHDYGGNTTYFLTERGDRGQYWIYPYVLIKEGPSKKPMPIEPMDIRFKQTLGNKYLAIMICAREIVYMLARINDVPPQSGIQDAVATLGHRSRGGKSYLYQGHHWMPIGEMDERHYWIDHSHDHMRKRFAFDYIFD